MLPLSRDPDHPGGRGGWLRWLLWFVRKAPRRSPPGHDPSGPDDARLRSKLTDPASDRPAELGSIGVLASAAAERAIEGLPSRSRIVFLMNRVDGLTYREIARELGISRRAVRRAMLIAIATVDRTLSDHRDG